ncbi:hypothetical protein J5N97_027701 [Dioscorea zingiberensis]|uniref:Uncharacterized protein n=1 Tax=Dioscorea zingiberensis TaxID=325984 RepID=A0A9D5BXP9_9LILI|nr:hypothetical protein J5N97_027701 [Dioscorea zingiberensis]
MSLSSANEAWCSSIFLVAVLGASSLPDQASIKEAWCSSTSLLAGLLLELGFVSSHIGGLGGLCSLLVGLGETSRRSYVIGLVAGLLCTSPLDWCWLELLFRQSRPLWPIPPQTRQVMAGRQSTAMCPDLRHYPQTSTTPSGVLMYDGERGRVPRECDIGGLLCVLCSSSEQHRRLKCTSSQPFSPSEPAVWCRSGVGLSRPTSLILRGRNCCDLKLSI